MSKKNRSIVNSGPVKFNIPDPAKQLANHSFHEKYTFGEISNSLSDVKNHKPVFAFDYLSLKSSNLCFDSKLINGVKEYHRLLTSLKTISAKTYDELSRDYSFHFHHVNFDDTTISESEFIKCLVADPSKVNFDSIPTVYQFKAFDKARIFGFIFKSVFYPVFFDRNHGGYKRK